MAHDHASVLARSGQLHLAHWADALDRGDPAGRVSPAARLLCCGLGELAQSAARCRKNPQRLEAGRAAAGLALLTKIDDEFIDAPGFHGGHTSDRQALRVKTRDFLAPTLEALRAGTTRSQLPRVLFAAEVGRQLQRCAVDAGRLEDLLDLIARGWATQVDAVEVLSARPGEVPLERLSKVTAAISGAWLAMITGVGLLGADRGLTPDEEAAFFGWGLWIQSADALADLEKDLGDQFGATLPVCIASDCDPAVMEAWRLGRASELRSRVIACGADRAVLPAVAQLDALGSRLEELGEVHRLLRWIHGFLLGRHLLRSPGTDHAAFAPFVTDWAAFAPTHAREAECSA